MPPIWSGTLTFGLVAIPIRMESAVHSHRVAFRQIHLEDHGRVRNRKICETDGQPLQPEDIGRAWEAPDGRLVAVTDDELDRMPLPTAKTIEVSGFLDLANISGERFDTPYFLAPASQAANKPYVLFREALAKARKGAIGKWALRGTGEALGIIYPAGDILVAHRLHWPDELRTAGDAAPREDVDLTEEEIQAALAYIDATSDLDMDQMHDQYTAAVQSLLDAKAAHKAIPKPQPADGRDASITDLMTALQRATEQARAERGQDADVHDMPKKRAATKATAKKTPAKKTPPKKTAASKTGAKKTAAKKTTAKKTAKRSPKRAG